MKKEIKISKTLLIILGGVLIVTILIILAVYSARNSLGFVESPKEACEASHNLIKQGVEPTLLSLSDILKAPASSQFLDCSHYDIKFVGLNHDLIPTTDSSIGVWMVSGPIDSENSFGALIRDYYCAAMFKGVDGWQIWQLNIKEQSFNCSWVTP